MKNESDGTATKKKNVDFLKELDRKYVEELDYTRHMNETVTQEENTNFFSGLRAMLAEQ